MIDHEIISAVIVFLPLIQEGFGCCQLQAKVYAWSAGLLSQKNSNRLDMTIAVDWDVKPHTKSTRHVFGSFNFSLIFLN